MQIKGGEMVSKKTKSTSAFSGQITTSKREVNRRRAVIYAHQEFDALVA